MAKRAGISDVALKAAVEEMRNGIIHANLGGNVYKQRVAVEGRGKRTALKLLSLLDHKGLESVL